MRDRFYQFSWRPRPPSLLSEAQLKDVARNLRKYSEKYAKEDDVLLAQVRFLKNCTHLHMGTGHLCICSATCASIPRSAPRRTTCASRNTVRAYRMGKFTMGLCAFASQPAQVLGGARRGRPDLLLGPGVLSNFSSAPSRESRCTTFVRTLESEPRRAARSLLCAPPRPQPASAVPSACRSSSNKIH